MLTPVPQIGFFMLEFDKYFRNLAAEKKKREEEGGATDKTAAPVDSKGSGCIDPGLLAAISAAAKGTARCAQPCVAAVSVAAVVPV